MLITSKKIPFYSSLKTLMFPYKSKTEVRLVYTKSFNLRKKAKVMYSAKPIPKVAKER